MISNEVRKAALAVVGLNNEQIRQAIQIGRAVTKAKAAKPTLASILRASRLLAGEEVTRKRKKTEDGAEPKNRTRRALGRGVAAVLDVAAAPVE